MLHHYTTETAATVAKVSPSGIKLPPATIWVDSILDDLFSNPSDAVHVLEPFDYQGFLRREGLV